ncbi:MAG: type II toxin-antitoxin system PrlF family antitoxin [Deltaproteobacteria bacterium]|nr:type II toxin-antitoxin system PrlF family antitoxin [Deltaproteobacteria bacterium]MBI4412342.1 type II toxin-antitoxin system PrlF family antitoxin [Deltaproteobacteria bacterium]
MSRLTRKFQITLPKPVRAALNVRSGEEVDFVISAGGRIQVVRKDKRAPFDKFVGLLKSVKTKDSDRIVAGLRGHKS